MWTPALKLDAADGRRYAPLVANLAHGVWRGSSLSVLITLNARGLATDEEWQPYAADATRLFAAGGDDPCAAGIRSLTLSDGGAPSASQRKYIREVLGGRRVRFALVSSSRFARGVATAIAWLQAELKVFAPGELRRALRFLDIPDAEVPSIWAAIVGVNAKIGIETVAEIARAGLEEASAGDWRAG